MKNGILPKLVGIVVVALLILGAFYLLSERNGRISSGHAKERNASDSANASFGERNETNETDETKPISLPSPSESNESAERNDTTEKNETVMTLEEILKLSQEAAMEAYMQQRKYIDTPLSLRLKETGAQRGDPIYIRIFKSDAILEVWVLVGDRFVHLKDYPICAYSGHLGPKLKEGDKQAPEGFYRVYPKQLNPHSRFHLAFNLGYPNAYDRAHGRTGSYLMVHGNCVSIGCYAMTDQKIEEIYALVESALKAGQKYVPVHIFPFRMDDETMAQYTHYKWYDFWTNLKEGYDYFEAEKLPPRVSVSKGEYVISESEY